MKYDYLINNNANENVTFKIIVNSNFCDMCQQQIMCIAYFYSPNRIYKCSGINLMVQ